VRCFLWLMGEMEVARRRRKRKKLLAALKDRRGYSNLIEEALDRTMWRNRCGRGFGRVVSQYWMNEPTQCTNLHHLTTLYGESIRLRYFNWYFTWIYIATLSLYVH
jgi:hypothetical protein